MQEVSQAWIDTNAAPFTVRSYITIWIYKNSGTGSLPIPPERILGFSSGFTGDMLAGEIPNIHASVKLDNSDGYYSEAFLGQETDEYEHAKSDIWIAFEFEDEEGDPSPESIRGGRLYVSEVNFDAENRTATIKFEDVLQFMNVTYEGTRNDYIPNIVDAVISQAVENKVVPVTDIQTILNPTLTTTHTVRIPEDSTLAETLQLCANAANCVLFVDRDGAIHIEPIDRHPQDYLISRDVQYIQPTINKDKSINAVRVRFSDAVAGFDSYTYRREDAIGAEQTVSNPAIWSIFNAMSVSRRTYRTLQENRQVISGEYRCDPRVDLFDCVMIAANKRPVTIENLELMPLNDIEALTIQELEEGIVEIGTYCMIALEMEFTGAWHGRFMARAVDQSSNENLKTWGDAKRLTWGQARDYSWDEMRGGYYV